jgi:hypothetical protein
MLAKKPHFMSSCIIHFKEVRFMVKQSACAILALVFALPFIGSCSGDDGTNPSKIYDMAGAIEKVRDDIIPDEVPPGAKYQCIRMDGSIAAGSTVVEDAPIGAGLREAPAKTVAVSEESYLFFLNLEPGALYSHDVKYIIVGKSGASKVIDAQWWPRINGETFDEFMKAVPDPNNVIDANVTLTAPVGMVGQFAFAALPIQYAEGFIAVSGLMPGDALFTEVQTGYLTMVNFFNEYKNRSSGSVEVNGLVQGDADNLLAAIHSMATSGKSVITIGIIAHGGTNGVCLGGVVVYASQLRAEIAGHPGVAFNLLIFSCHSGSFMDELQALSNVYVAHTASRADQSAWPDWDEADGVIDYDPSDVGIEWTSAVLAAAYSLITNSTSWSTIMSMASSAGVPVPCMLFHEACYCAVGANPGFGCTQNLDLCSRVGAETPMGYAKWESPGK